MEGKRVGIVVAVVAAVVFVIVAAVWLLRGPSSQPPADTVDLTVIDATEAFTDDYGHGAGSGNTTLIVRVAVMNHLSTAVVLGNSSFNLTVGSTDYPGVVAPPGTVTVDAGQTTGATVEFEVPSGVTTTRIRVSEGAAIGSAAFARQTRPGGPPFMGLYLRSMPDNWTGEVLTVASGMLPASTYALIRDSDGTTVLSRTPFSKLTQANWSTYGLQYEDMNPMMPEIRPADLLIISKTMYPAGSVLEISDDYGIMVTAVLQ